MKTENADRYGRQNLIVPPDKVRDAKVLVVGVGAIGRQVALLLSQLGITDLTLVDMDIVEITNTSSQGYNIHQLGQEKVMATGMDCMQNNPDMTLNRKNRPYYQDTAPYVFSCVDSMEVRLDIFNKNRETGTMELFVDGRMGGEQLKVLTVSDGASGDYYEETWFPDSEADDLPCAARATGYCATIAAGIMVAQFTKHLRGFWLPKEINFSILGLDLTTKV